MARVCEKSADPTGSAGVSPVPALTARTPGRARHPRSQDFSQTLDAWLVLIHGRCVQQSVDVGICGVDGRRPRAR